MINNRQGGRRRGRGGQQPRGMSGNNSGNARDNRQRGNAAQLHEKYKSMARDSQLAGDRVQTEYYLQFADHYFRLLGENRPRFDEQRPRNADDDHDNDEDGDDRMDSDMDGESESSRDSDDQAQQQRGRPDDSPQRSRARPAGDRNANSQRRDRPNGRGRDEDDGRDRPSAREDANERIDFAVLPPAIGADLASNDSADQDEQEAPRPRRRARSPKAAVTGDDSPDA